MSDGSKVLEFGGYRWRGIDVHEYESHDRAAFKDVTRQTLLGEGTGEAALTFVTRYFEVQPGGYTSLEQHEHPHAVVILRGAGRVILGDKTHEVAPFDCVYVGPDTTHQFRATGDGPLGFLCVVDRVRDRPQPS
jgi:quercetin dioxygenase-like cupin family protein